jgi:glycerophosphoryl diester phosphodiesterase
MKAVDVNADGIELDIRLARDKKIVVIHDPVTDRTGDRPGRISELDYRELKEIDFGIRFSEKYANERIPLLSEVLDYLKSKDTVLNIEVKNDPDNPNRELEAALVDMLKSYAFAERIIISSFDHFALRYIKQLNRSLQIAPLYMSRFVDIWHYAKGIDAYAVHPAFYAIDKDSVKNCIKEGIAVNVWTVDKAADIKRAVDMGVYGIITNEPENTLRILMEASGGTDAL